MHRLPKDTEDLCPFFNAEFLDPLDGLEGFLCNEINTLGNIYHIDIPFGTSDLGLLTFQ